MLHLSRYGSGLALPRFTPRPLVRLGLGREVEVVLAALALAGLDEVAERQASGGEDGE